MNVVAIMMAAGNKSTLKRKNAYPILGHPMLWWALTEATKARFIDEVFVWTEDEQLARITKQCRCQVVPRTKDQEYYHGGMSNPNDWGLERNAYIEKYIGGPIDIGVYLNCNYVLMTADILEGMYRTLMEDMTAKDVWPVARVQGDYFTKHHGKLFPVWHCQDLKHQDYPPFFLRGSGISISHLVRQRKHVELQSAYYEVEAKYLLDIHDLEGVELAEFYLPKRGKNEV